MFFNRGFVPSFSVVSSALCLSMTVACSGSGASIDVSDSGPLPVNNGSTVDAATSGPNGDDGTSNGSHSEDAGSADTASPSHDPSGDHGGDDASSDASIGPPKDDAGSAPHGLDPNVSPGGNFDLSVWELQEPFGSPGAPTTIAPAQLEGANGFHDKYFFTDPKDGAMTFFDPENGVTTPNSNYPRCELREMTSSGAAANWLAAGTHTLSATVKATSIPDHVAVGQIHIGTGMPASTKPLLELFYFASGKIVMAIEQSPAGGNEVQHTVGNVPLGTKWSYVIGLSGNTISFVLDGGAPQAFAMAHTFDKEGMYFKAGNYDQSVGTDGNISSTVQFYSLAIHHGP